MLTKSENFVAAENAGKNPQVYVYLSTDLTRRLFTFDGSTSTTSGSGLWDGSRYVGDGLSYGAELGVTEAETLLVDVSPINKGSSQSNRQLLTSLSATNIGNVSVSLDNLQKKDGRYFFSDIKYGTLPEKFVNQSVEVRIGFEGLAFGDQISLYRGITIDDTLKGKDFRIASDAITGTLYDVYELPKSSLYTNPSQDNQALPIVLGDMTENSDIDKDGDGTVDQGPIPLVCIDTVNDVWALASHPIQTTGGGNTVTLYDDDGVISSGDYTLTVSGDYESVGVTIAYVTFSTPPTGQVTGKYKGAVDGSDNLITNPAECIEKLLSLMGDTTGFDTTSFQAAVNDANDNSYTCAGLVLGDNIKAFWITDILSSFLGSWFLNERDQIVLQFDTGSTDFTATAAHLTASTDDIGLPTIQESRDNIITRPIINYALSYAQIDRRYKNDALTNYLQTYANTEVTGDISQELEFNWTRNTATVSAVNDRIIALYGSGIKLYTWKTTDFTLLSLEPGDFISYTNEWEYDTDGNVLKNQVGKVYNVVINLKNQEIELSFYDTGNYKLAEPDLWDGSRYVGDGLPYGGQRAA